MKKEKTLYLIDGTAYIHRAYHAIRNLSNSKGLPTNAIFGFTKMILKLLKDHKPEYVAMVFDSKGKTFRHEMYQDYKANRSAMPEDLVLQIPYIKQVTQGFNLPIIEMPGFEADDLIGTISHEASLKGYSVIMVSGDKDFVQLVSENSIIFDPMKEKTTDLAQVNEKFGVTPKQMIDVMGFSGDSSDNIPGVPGIGPKTALSLIQTYKSMELLYDHIDEITKKKQKENLIQFKDQAFLSKKLVTIDINAPIDFDLNEFKSKSPDNIKLSKLFQDLEFRQLQLDVSDNASQPKKNYKAIFTKQELVELISKLKNAGIFAIDTETTSVNPHVAKLVGLSFAFKDNEAFYVPVGHANPEDEDLCNQLNLQDVLNLLKDICEDENIKKIGQNIKYDKIVLLHHGIDLKGLYFDTMLASYLLNPSKRAHNLDQIAIDFLGYKKIAYKDLTKKSKKIINFNQVHIKGAYSYACEDADITYLAYKLLLSNIKETELFNLLTTLEMPLMEVLLKMETNGINVNKKYLNNLSNTFGNQINELETQIYDLADEEFNINSPQQLGFILFDKLHLPVQKKTKKKTGYSTDAEVLTALKPYHKICRLIIKYRTLSKLKSTYADSLANLINEETGRIHTSFNQTVTATGRLSSSDPNLQNIPIKSDEGKKIREAFIPKLELNTKWYLVSADYSQIELRILAHYANDKILIKAFLDDEDIHSRTASEIFNALPMFITPELRNQAKAVNFGIIYGMSAYGLSKELGISQKIAKTYINNYFLTYSGVKNFIDKTIEEAKRTKQTTTLLGRIRQIPEINSSNNNVRQFAERVAINTPIQGTAADLIKLAMIKVEKNLIKNNLNTKMLLSVHDEIVFEAPEDELNELTKIIKDEMENVFTLRVPLKININKGENWAQAH